MATYMGISVLCGIFWRRGANRWGALKVRIPNPHKGGIVDGPLVREIPRQAGISIDQWDNA
jgi:hypothetical protein